MHVGQGHLDVRNQGAGADDPPHLLLGVVGCVGAGGDASVYIYMYTHICIQHVSTPPSILSRTCHPVTEKVLPAELTVRQKLRAVPHTCHHIYIHTHIYFKTYTHIHIYVYIHIYIYN